MKGFKCRAHLPFSVCQEIFLLTLGCCPLRAEDQKAMFSFCDQLCPSLMFPHQSKINTQPGYVKLVTISSLKLFVDIVIQIWVCCVLYTKLKSSEDTRLYVRHWMVSSRWFLWMEGKIFVDFPLLQGFNRPLSLLHTVLDSQKQHFREGAFSI